ncbi:hypothetical protein K0M31_018267 [Melipona bicolor]|uniref:Uncharacterized protein n=1 Tax=Melipona bicolor TaxID=60889 RepID=A0AA40KDW8_9HYME|nr:hypothetical protein K0M31_018267 [Melipona bicolor]
MNEEPQQGHEPYGRGGKAQSVPGGEQQGRDEDRKGARTSEKRNADTLNDHGDAQSMGKHLQLSNVSKRDDISNRALLCQRPLWLSKPVREEEFLKLFDRVRSWDRVDYGRLFAKMFVYFERVSICLAENRMKWDWFDGCSVSIAFDIPSMIGNPDSRWYRLGVFVT